ncbi:MAG: thiamine pyrophosphate-dependent dehydrogenase E1 component subunit alpha [Dehalobacter sp.]|nr:thiamine pyrophosphate-dependent dehydrogenase E1 component subunit alpha [Dehalobacter sp.]
MNLKKNLYRHLYRIRAAEQKIIALYNEDDMKTPVHLSIGEEAIISGVVEALKPSGQAFGTFRSHALYIAMAEETDLFFLELYGKSGYIANGKAGSMHLSNPQSGLLYSSAIVASTISLAVGAAYANKRLNKPIITACFMGDGAVEEGVFWESLNVACLMHLPVLFVYEDNGLAIHADFSTRKGYDSFQNIIMQYNCLLYDTGDSTDAEEIYHVASAAMRAISEKQKPAVLCSKYYRYYEHVGINFDFNAGYRSRDEFEIWNRKDPVLTFRSKLDISIAEEIEEDVNCQIDLSVRKAKEAPFASSEELYKGVYE